MVYHYTKSELDQAVVVNDIAGIIAGALIGAELGGWVGAIVGIIVGIIFLCCRSVYKLLHER